ncbi:hypothetical protein [Limosilactobacillus reuteri]|uniref:hypothetical protein n=1 Tax=Limosilactobacillus reuteri TaxID=1598 RepID=UPI001E35BE7C|nr:hypothetical protein [Limosilactobacillus reuteri]MCC4485911.1 hypothetical protein [Limosilactobacillus reuteri]UFK69111.1 hypothetical protein IVR12_02222 [Limosilactobacillus reuteri]
MGVDNKRTLNKWVVRLAYVMQLDRQSRLMTKALFDENHLDVDLDLTSINVSFDNKVKLAIYEWFNGLPEDLLEVHGIKRTSADFERLYQFPLEKYLLMDEEQLSHYRW